MMLFRAISETRLGQGMLNGRRVTLLVASMLCTSTAVGQILSKGSSGPETHPFASNANWGMRREADVVCGYGLSSVRVMPSGKWVMFAISKYAQSPTHTQSENVALGALHVDTGRTLQLTVPERQDETRPKLSLAGDPATLPLDDTHCGVILVTSSSPVEFYSGRGANAYTIQFDDSGLEGGNRHRHTHSSASHQSVLWEWGLDANAVRRIGPWHPALTRVAGTLDLWRCNAKWTAPDDYAASGYLEWTDPMVPTGKAKCRLKKGSRDLFAEKESYAPAAQPSVLTLCDAENPSETEIYCLDPQSLGGIRWKWGPSDLVAIVGDRVQNAAFLPNLTYPTRQIPLLVGARRDNNEIVQLLFVDSSNGRCADRHTLSISWPVMLPVISPDAKRIVCPMCDDTDGAANRFCTIDLGTRQIRTTRNLIGVMDYVFAWGFIDNDRVIVSDSHAIWELDTRGCMRMRELFRLNNRE
jgi:hypothetical protein